jgi:simple sugar transport system substrate-binding protein
MFMRKSRFYVGITGAVLLSATVLTGVSTTTANAAGRWCTGVKIVGFPGGPAGGAFAINVYNGMVQAAKDLGPRMKYYWSNWDPNLATTQLTQAIAQKPDAIVGIIGQIGDASADPLIAKAWAQGTIIENANDGLAIADAKYNAQGEGYVGATNYTAGQSLGNEVIKRDALVKGDEVFVWGLKGAAGDRAKRTIGILDALTAAGMKIDYQEIDQATNTSASAGTPTFVGEMSAHPGIKAVIIDHGGVTSAAQTFLKAAGLAPGKVYVAGFDMSPATATAIEGGWVSLVIDQQEWLQGYIPVLNACLTKKFGFSGLNVNTSAGFVDKSNIKMIAPLANLDIR